MVLGECGAGLDPELLRAYVLLRRAGHPVGVREAQRILGYGSPGKAQRILRRLERSGMAHRLENGKYLIEDNPPPELVGRTIIGGYVIPRILFLAVYSTIFSLLISLLLGVDDYVKAGLALLTAPLWIEAVLEYRQLRSLGRLMRGE